MFPVVPKIGRFWSWDWDVKQDSESIDAESPIWLVVVTVTVWRVKPFSCWLDTICCWHEYLHLFWNAWCLSLCNSILVSCAPTGPKTIWSEHCKINEQLCQAAEQLCGFLGLRAPASVRLLPCFCFLFSFPAGALFQISSCAAWPVTVSLEFPTLSSNAELWAAKK